MQAKEGDVVRVHYTGRLTDGTQFDSSVGREPLEFTVGAGQMIKGFDTGVRGMAVGEKKTIEIAPQDAYGEREAGARNAAHAPQPVRSADTGSGTGS
jgi:FKBP-type peptidyl-prolyl cis-trans isomerase